MASKERRAARFGLEDSAPSYAPAEVPEDEVKKQQRAERFGTEFKAAEGLMDIGAFSIDWTSLLCQTRLLLLVSCQSLKLSMSSPGTGVQGLPW